MAGHWLEWTCCGLWPFGKPTKRKYDKILEEPVYKCSERVRQEINKGLPPGVSVGDLIFGDKSTETLNQAHLLALQSNHITEYLARFNAAEIPASCQGIVSNQIAKLKAMQSVLWNAMISIATSNVELSDSGFKMLLHKQACENMTLLEMEKLATAISVDNTTTWAREISNIVITQPTPAALEAVPEKQDPIYDNPEGTESAMLLQPSQQKKTTATQQQIL
ncbi:orf55 [Alcelaphine gammaherpesvirus 2]|uniref:Orf55 n=1 Tax=Alcelaphine gammaherpesvirus 2 TaxID=138184 RepID=A0A068ADG4_9GAMA|nr:orf55 [Alcelaphine gammaherpesvirus 2]AIA62092.1 orf55 [Alcelaphine gammaherpesvirus 2]